MTAQGTVAFHRLGPAAAPAASLEGAGRPFGRRLQVDQVVADDVVDARIAGDECYAVLFALDGQQAGTERLGEADAALVRGGRVACDRHDQGSGEALDVPA